MDDFRKTMMELKSEVESLKIEREQDKATIRNLEENNRDLRRANIQLQETIHGSADQGQAHVCCPLVRCAKILMRKT